MASFSGQYNFLSPQSKVIIENSFGRAGCLPQKLTQEKIDSAQEFLNFIFQSWPNRGLNLWQVETGMLALIPNKSAYQLPANTLAILEATTRTSTRNLGGTPFSSAGGNAAAAFNPGSGACTQTAPNGYISYNWGQAQFSIGMLGVQSNATSNYSLVAEYSFDNVTWTQVLSIPTQSYTASTLLWFAIPVPTPANLFRIRETNGATLNIQQLYFNSQIIDTMMSPYSRSEYIASPNKTVPGRPANFYLDRQITPIVYVYPTPTAQFNNMFYSFTSAIQDVGTLQNSAQIPSRFLDPAAAELSFYLGLKYRTELEISIDLLDRLKGWADESFKRAQSEDRERVPIRIYGDYFQGWTSP